MRTKYLVKCSQEIKHCYTIASSSTFNFSSEWRNGTFKDSHFGNLSNDYYMYIQQNSFNRSIFTNTMALTLINIKLYMVESASLFLDFLQWAERNFSPWTFSKLLFSSVEFKIKFCFLTTQIFGILGTNWHHKISQWSISVYAGVYGEKVL